jgi:hypothetical protein
VPNKNLEFLAIVETLKVDLLAVVAQIVERRQKSAEQGAGSPIFSGYRHGLPQPRLYPQAATKQSAAAAASIL